MKPSVCPSCGARMSPGAERCTLCGARPSEDVRQSDLEEPGPAQAQGVQPQEETTTAEERVYCSSCGTGSPAFAHYCWKCGDALVGGEATASPARRPTVATGKAVDEEIAGAGRAGRQALLMVAGAVAAVVLLFAITQISGRTDPLRPQPEQGAAEAATPGMPQQIRAQVDALEEQIAATDDGAERLALRQELVDVLVSGGAFARAGEVQEAIAREVDTVEAWAEAGSFFLAHVLRADSPEQVIFAERSARSFEQALALRPGDLDIMTDLATAYRYHPDDPMRAVTLIQEVLAEDADHPRARFNYGVMLAEIGRTEQARGQFEHIVENPDADEFVQARAREMLESMRRPNAEL